MNGFNSSAISHMMRNRIDSAINQRLDRTNNARDMRNISSSRPAETSRAEQVSFEEALQVANPLNSISLGVPNTNFNPAIDAAVTAASIQHGVDANLIRAVIRAESSGNPLAVSHAGAQGLMQLMPATARNLGVTDPFDITQNVNAGTAYLRSLLDRFSGDVELALAAYNAGWPRVQQHGGIPPFAETQTYVPRVLGFREEYALQQYAQNIDLRRR